MESKRKKSYRYQVYIAIFFIICMIPSAGLIFGGYEQSGEHRETAPVPALSADSWINPCFLNDAGKWFEDHFAFRNEWVGAYGLLMERLFGVSAQEKVIVGKNGWLYYKDSLNDFQGAQQMADRQLFDIAHSLSMVQKYAAEQDVKFVFFTAPNKNSLYGEAMPYFYQAFHTTGSSRKRLEAYLKREGVPYVDLYKLFSRQDKILYHKRDSHWNNEGAALAADAVLSFLEKEHPDYTYRRYIKRRDFTGDLDHMLYPAFGTAEPEIYYEPLPQFSYCEETESNFEPKISTRSSGSGSLVMYRDSFGNALLPFMAEAFGYAYFSRALPYYLPDLAACEADTLIIERAERFLPDMAKEAPYMPAPSVPAEIADAEKITEIPNFQMENQGIYTRVTGYVPVDRLKTDSRIYLEVDGKNCFEAFPVSCEDGKEGFSMLLETDILSEKGNTFLLYIS